MRKLTPTELAEREAFFMWTPPEKGPFDPRGAFDNDHPLHIEVGSGRGEWIARRASQSPNINFLAIECKYKRMPAIMRELTPQTHPNVRVCRLFLDDDTVKRMPPASVECVYILHPDPWPKRRHWPRRLIQPSFLDVIAWLLSPDGEVIVHTDHPEYAQWIARVFAEHRSYTPLPYELDENYITTYFEHKKRLEGYEPVRTRYRRVDPGLEATQ